MSKLTTERLEELANATTPSVKYVGREIIAMARRLLAYEQAAKNPVAWTDSDELEDANKGYSAYLFGLEGEANKYSDPRRKIMLYAAPVLPKQPELVDLSQQVEILNRILYWILKELPVPTQKASAMAIRLSSVIDVISDLEVSAPAQPVIPEQTERERIRREHAEWSDATFGNVGPVGPLKHLSKEALEAAADPDDLLELADMQFLLWDAQRRAGIPDDFITVAMIEKLEINKKRQWPEPKDGEPRLHINTQSAQPVSEPYKSAANDIIAERQRQISEEGWTPEHDDRYSCGELAGAAACYARYTNARGWVFPTNPSDYQSAEEPSDWPWAAEWWKPTNPRRDLVKAGALILAEIERLDRAAPAQESE